MMRIILILLVALNILGCASQPQKNEIWWMVDGGFQGTCTKSEGKLYWLTPETLVNDYGCKIMKTEHEVTSLECIEGDLAGKSYAFSKNKKMCHVFAKILQEQKL